MQVTHTHTYEIQAHYPFLARMNVKIRETTVETSISIIVSACINMWLINGFSKNGFLFKYSNPVEIYSTNLKYVYKCINTLNHSD